MSDQFLDRNEPLDSDSDGGSPRPRRLATTLMVAAGGMAGTALRASLSAAAPDVLGLPVGIFAINILGAFVLGFLLESLARRGPDRGLRRGIRLLAGTGLIGGFTTYSALAVGASTLLTAGNLVGFACYALATVVLGAVASWCGITLSRATIHEKRAV
ncbi:CrcB family protein [soil metagenome]